MFNFSVFVSNHVSLGNNATPGNYRMFFLEVKGNPICSFTDYFQMAFHCTPEHPILLIMIKGFLGDKFLYGFGRIPYIP